MGNAGFMPSTVSIFAAQNLSSTNPCKHQLRQPQYPETIKSTPQSHPKPKLNPISPKLNPKPIKPSSPYTPKPVNA